MGMMIQDFVREKKDSKFNSNLNKEPVKRS